MRKLLLISVLFLTGCGGPSWDYYEVTIMAVTINPNVTNWGCNKPYFTTFKVQKNNSTQSVCGYYGKVGDHVKVYINT